jgi:FkbM family methyltransferase
MVHVDIDLLNRSKAPSGELVLEPGCFTNWLGLKTDASMFASCEKIRDTIRPEIPSGGDGVYGGYAEYASFLTAIEQTPYRSSFTAIELGAGWGPWISGIGKVCQRMGFADIHLVGVEADEEKCALMRQHMARNGLAAKVIHAAAWHEDTMLKFPVIHRQDHGAAASTEPNAKDYRGIAQSYVDVPGLSLKTICEGPPVIDYMHWDIQGAELALAESHSELLNSRVRFLFIGTHSRPIEGGLIEFFFRHQWDVLLQHPCDFTYDRLKPEIAGMTTTDGEIFARNPRFFS